VLFLHVFVFLYISRWKKAGYLSCHGRASACYYRIKTILRTYLVKLICVSARPAAGCLDSYSEYTTAAKHVGVRDRSGQALLASLS